MPGKKERREESDRRIIEAAVKSFGQIGYTYSTIRDMAKAAGITSGLITQRYTSKENLFLTAYNHVMENAFSETDSNASPRECLCGIIRDIEKLSSENPDAFAFCNMLHNAADYPKDVLKPYQEQMKKNNAYEILQKAQAQGMLPEGNLDSLLGAFGATVFHNVGMCRRYGLEYTKPELYLEFIRFSDEQTMRAVRWHRILETAIANTFDFLVYVNIPKNTGELLKSSEQFAVREEFADARYSVEQAVLRLVPAERQPTLQAHLNLDTLSDRMKGRKSISLQIMDIDGKRLVHTFLPISWDDQGTLAEVFAGIYRVNPNGLPD